MYSTNYYENGTAAHEPAMVGSATSRRVIFRNKLKQQCVRTAIVIVVVSMCTEGIGNEPLVSSSSLLSSGSRTTNGTSRGPASTTLFAVQTLLTNSQQQQQRKRDLPLNLFRRGNRKRVEGPPTGSIFTTPTTSSTEEDSPRLRPNESSTKDDQMNQPQQQPQQQHPQQQQQQQQQQQPQPQPQQRVDWGEKGLFPPQQQCYGPRPGPPPPQDMLPLRFLLAGGNDPDEGWRRFRATLEWRHEQGINDILREPCPHFHLIQQHYWHHFHGTGHRGEPIFYERPGQTNLAALRQGGVNLRELLRYYMQITEFQWQYLNRDDRASSIYVVDLRGIRFADFVGDAREFVLSAARSSAQHYPERGGKVLLIHVPVWFQLIWRAIRPMVSESTLHKIYLLRGEADIRQTLQEFIPLEHIPSEYGGTSPIPLGESAEEQLLARLMRHNNLLAEQKQTVCSGCTNALDPADWPCPFCRWVPARSY